MPPPLLRLNHELKVTVKPRKKSERKPRRDDKPPAPGLPRAEARKLEYYFLAFETDAGLHSVWNSAIMAANGIKGGSSGGFDPPGFNSVGSDDFRDARQVHRKLRKMSDSGLKSEVAVLYKFYGPQHVNARHGVWAEYAQLANMTPIVHKVREDAVKEKHAELVGNARFKLAHMGITSRDADDRVFRSTLKEAEGSETIASAIEWALSLNRPEVLRKMFVDTVMKQSVQMLNSASRAYMETRI